MKQVAHSIPLSIYIHLPWCIRKCPYCDFNSHEFDVTIPEDAYVSALIEDAKRQHSAVIGRAVDSIFFGGGTPSLFSAAAIGKIIDTCTVLFSLSDSAEITLEANPGATDKKRFEGYRAAGVNRLSIGVQSFFDPYLQTLGRVHSSSDAHASIITAQQSGFENINIDLMFGLPQQSLQQAMLDLQIALQHQPQHISYYQLTIEPNTVFAKHPPKLTQPDTIDQMQDHAITLLQQHQFHRYEISAYSRLQSESRHNLNYWQFGDYIGLGAGAHGKITDLHRQQIVRTQNKRMPKSYMQAIAAQQSYQKVSTPLTTADRQFEFLLNALRLTNGVSTTTYEARTFNQWDTTQVEIQTALQRGLLEHFDDHICATDLGFRHLNDTLALFLTDQ